MKGLTITLLVASVLSIAPAVQAQGRKSLKPSFEPPLLSLGVAGPASMVAAAQGVARSWGYTGSLNIARVYHTATLLSDGRVLVVGGSISANTAELYDPLTEAWSVTGSLNTPRIFHTATLLPDGKVLVVGYSAELYDPDTGTWSVTGSLNTPRILHTATLLQNGKVLVAGGDDGKGGEFSSPLHTAELYDPATGMWSLAGNLNAAIQEHTATQLQNGKVLVVGGYGSGSAINNAEVYDPDTGTWSSVGSSSTNYRLYYSATLLADGRVLIVGGHDYGGGSLRKTVELYDPNTGRWSNTGQLNIRRMSHTATLLPNGKVLVAGGSLFSSLVTSELYDPDTGTWSFTDNLNTPRSDHTATLLPDGKVLIVGGLRSSAGNSFSLDSVELGYNFAAVATPAPYITMASVAGKRLWVEGENFVSGAVILINGEEQKTKNYALDPRSTLIGKKAGKKIKAGDKLQVRNPDGTLSEEFIFTGS